MQLSYLGQPYEAHSPAIEAFEIPETATFMGKPYALKQYQVEQPPMPPEELTFMGQRYVRSAEPKGVPCQPRPGERMVSGKQLMQLQRSRTSGRRHPAFRGS